MARLAAAVQEQHRRPALAEHVGYQAVTGSAGEDRGPRFDGRHGCFANWTDGMDATRVRWTSWTLREEVEDARLEHLVANREHVIAARDVESARTGNYVRKFLRRTTDRILGADRDQHRHAQRLRLLPRERLPRAADARRQRAAIALGLFGEDPEGALLLVGHIGEGRRFQRLGHAERQPAAVDQLNAQASEHGGAHALGMRGAEERAA